MSLSDPMDIGESPFWQIRGEPYGKSHGYYIQVKKKKIDKHGEVA
jgi:hypothetical protein